VRVDPEELDKMAAYRLMTSIIVPRPIAWVGSRSPEGVDNLAPFSFFNGVSTQPPIVSVSVARGRGGVLKDTARNVLERGELSISIVSMDLLHAMHQSSANYERSVSEFKAVDLEAVQCDLIDAPRPKAARVSMECRLHDAIDLGNTHLILARVIAFHIADDLLKEGKVNPQDLDPVARLGGNYAQLGAIHDLPRPKP
jgi:flavin reductase (DIM6/NTAB) family NADH-FMN oxidoreductase RutF